MTNTTDTAAYYARRASEYERVYDKPERQTDLLAIRAMVAERLAGHRVLEVACGTGFWTEPISRTATSILATDINEEVLNLARTKHYPNENVRFAKTDALTLEGISGSFTAAFVGFFWSHIPVGRTGAFLSVLHSKLPPGALLVVIDNNHVEGSNTPISHTDEDGNTYQRRVLDDGSTHEIIKNFPSESELREVTDESAHDVQYAALRYYWCLTYRAKPTRDI
ncbi:MAG: class I SAM-dependent methyltransferase [Phycisphaerales bacterium]|nr:MAG: class I SAM-dependent methyltransferase [Phycisphaerales bacterium]